MNGWERLTRWEFWPFQVFYIPVYLFVLMLGARARCITFFTALNPLMEFGGFVDYSKWRVHRSLPERFAPATVFVPPVTRPAGTDTSSDERLRRARRAMEAAGFAYPVIAKPDRGERGLGVARLNSDRDLARYLASAPVGTLIQRWIPGDREFGVLFCRDPVTDRGWISSVVIKDPLEVVGDGRSTLSELIDTSDRARIFRSRLVRQYRERLTEIPAAGARVPLSEFGNHSRGSIFRDGNRCITPELTRRFQEISRGIDGFYCGRFDIKAQSIEAITRGEFVILELNGAASEPAHIYDPHNTLLRAYRDLFRHWVTIYEISRTNRRRGVAADSLWRTIAAIRRHAREGSVLRSNTLGL